MSTATMKLDLDSDVTEDESGALATERANAAAYLAAMRPTLVSGERAFTLACRAEVERLEAARGASS